MQDNVTWLSHLVRTFTRNNSMTLLRTDDAVFQQVKSYDGSTVASPFGARGALVFRDTGANYRGSALVTYRSLSLPALFAGIQPKIWLYNPKTLRELAAELIRVYGAPLQADWFIDGPFDYSTMPQVVTLTTYRTDFTTQESITITVDRADVDVNEIFKNTTMTAPQTSFTPVSARTSAEFTYKYDFTPANFDDYTSLLNYPTAKITTLAAYQAAEVQSLVSLLADRLQQPIAYEVTADLQPNQICFKNSVLVYNGKTSGYVHPDRIPWYPGADGWYDNVLVVRFDTAVSGFQGLAYFHYNDLT